MTYSKIADMKTIDRIWLQGRDFARMIKFSHTVFALPFALSAVVLAKKEYTISFSALAWILVAMVGARSAAMGFNRIADAALDKENPRTANREIPAGRLTIKAAWLFVLLFSILFIFAAAMLSRLCLYLSVPVLMVLFAYSFTKRFTVLCHIYLGFAISLAPMGAWIALTGSFSLKISMLSVALMAYIAGFDILYACQDIQFDRKAALHSIPAKFGVSRALLAAAGLHVISFLFMLGMLPVFGLNAIYLVSIIIIAVLFIMEHRMVKPDDLSQVNIAFFHMNSIISVLFFIGILLDTLIR